MKLKAVTATILSLCLLASSSAVFAAHAAAAADAHAAAQTQPVAQPKPAGTSGAHDLAKKHRNQKVVLWVAGVALAAVIIGTSGSGKSSSGTTGSTAP